MGYAIAPDDGMDAATLLKRADAAIFQQMAGLDAEVGV